MSTFSTKSVTPIEQKKSIHKMPPPEILPKLEMPILDSQVKPKKQQAPRRSFSAAYKTKILAAYDACENSDTRGALLRKEGLYHTRIAARRHQQSNGKNKLTKTQKNIKRVDHLLFENAQLIALP